MTVVVNIKHTKCDVYCGRPHFLGNPFVIGRDGDRKEVIDKYRSWFYLNLTNKNFSDKVLMLKNKKLGCWCHPLSCHLDIVSEYLNNSET